MFLKKIDVQMLILVEETNLHVKRVTLHNNTSEIKTRTQIYTYLHIYVHKLNVIYNNRIRL